MIDPGAVDVAVAILREEVGGLVAIYRFGSAATAAERVDSDLDLAALTEAPLSEEEQIRLRWDVAERIAARIGRDVDLVDLGGASTVFRARVVATGDRIWCGDANAADHFETRAFSAYARLNEERAGILADIGERGRVHGR